MACLLFLQVYHSVIFVDTAVLFQNLLQNYYGLQEQQVTLIALKV